MRFPHYLLILILAGLFPVLAGCPSTDDDDSSDDDDATGDDDDDDDDDDGTGDDDDATGKPISCDGTLPIFDETEPNDSIDTVFDVLGELAEGFCIEGTLTCGDEDYLDIDHARFAIPEARDVTMTLDWTGNSDADSYLWLASNFDPEPEKGDEPLISWEEGFSGSESGTASLEAATAYVTRIGCWYGVDTPYTLTLSWDTIVFGDDDDSAGDDDDSAGDDDDATGDDDDSAGDDDDSAAGDDDDSAAGDDDDSAVTCAQEVLGNAIDDDCDGQTDEYTYSDVFSLLLSANCSCHSGASHPTGWFFNGDAATGYGNLVGVNAFELGTMPRIDPGSATNSYLMHKLDGTAGSVGGSTNTQMPLSGGPLTTAQIEGVRGWINSGAAND